ncbi:MAG: hypothetical protein GF317_02375, partial [Candidatus Lokiarchaeota archaeon]|nr:hypothetical protein [Candidatus Lokiarchaeota archaeon]MBD3198752.1 hypothetical protein [Candidatus Lokiarchaeota archaeon]
MSLINKIIDLELKIKHYKLPFIILFLFWFLGFLFFLIIEPTKNIGEIFLLSITVRTSSIGGDFASFYVLVFPILIEVVIFGFIIGELLEQYNPVITSRILCHFIHNHTVIIGYDHLSVRIIEHCIENKRSFCIIEDNEEKVEDYINNGFPVLVGDPTETGNLINANIDDAKEVFICTNDVRISIICSEKIRNYNKTCPIYVRVFEDHVHDYLEQEPLNAFAFSMSEWAMDAVIIWSRARKGKALIIGYDHLCHRLAYDISLQEDREAYLFDHVHDGIEFPENDKLHIISEFPRFLSDIRKHVNLNEFTQVYIFWTSRTEFDEAIYLSSKISLRYPDIEIFVRVFDDELKEVVERYNAKTFSSSLYAFKLLQKKVRANSSIA